MASKKHISKRPIGVKQLPIHQIYWFYDRNPRTEVIDFNERSLDDVARSLLRSHWDMSLGICTGVHLSAADRKLGFQLRQAKWDELRTAAKGAGPDADPIYMLKGFEALYCSDPGTPKAKLIPQGPEASESIMCYRRSIAMWRAAYLVASNSVKKLADNSAYETPEQLPETMPEILIPIQIFDDLDAEERLILALRENEGKTDGAKKLTEKDRFLAGGKLFASGNRQAEFRRVFKDGTGQKIYGVYQTDTIYPAVDLKNRVLRAFGLNEDLTAFEGEIENLKKGEWSYTGKKCAVPFAKLDKVDVGAFARRSAPDGYTADKHEVERYIATRLSDSDKAVESMAPTNIKKLMDGVPMEQAKMALESVLNNSGDSLLAFANKPGSRESHLILHTLVKYGHGIEARDALNKVSEKYIDEIEAAEKAELAAKKKAEAEAAKVAKELGSVSAEAETDEDEVEEEVAVAGPKGKGRGRK